MYDAACVDVGRDEVLLFDEELVGFANGERVGRYALSWKTGCKENLKCCWRNVAFCSVEEEDADVACMIISTGEGSFIPTWQHHLLLLRSIVIKRW